MSNKKVVSNAEAKVNKKACRCRDCVHAHLIQYGKNPVIAECTKKPTEGNTRFPYAVDVASTLKSCAIFGQRLSAEEIEHRPVRYTEFLKGKGLAA